MKRSQLNTSVYSLARAVGLSAVARRATRRGLRILCYHGFSLADEHEWSPNMFMSGPFFRRRMQMIAESGMPVVPLDSVLRNDYPDNAIVITIDDGWEGTLKVAAPILSEFGFPATLYLSSYYSETRTQVFNVMAHYLLWKTGKTRVSMPQWSIDLEFGRESLGETLASLRQLGHGIGRDERQRLGDELARALDVNSEGLFYYLSLDQLRELDRLGIDLQLHTHRHRFDGIERSEAREEVTANRAYLDHVRAVPRRHFCYPSGAYTTPQLTWLRELDVLTATTCEPGLNYPDQDRLQLNRILDSQDIPEVWFKALLDGLPFFARSALSRTRRRAPYVG